MFLIAGLGNPGAKYQDTRHNIGFEVVDRLAQKWNAPAFQSRFRGEFAKLAVGGEQVALLKPQTFMNRSGDAVSEASSFFKIPPEQIVVVHDELDLPFGVLRIKVGGGLAGHNGLRSISARCGGSRFLRVRVGIDKPPRGPGASWVLHPFSPEEKGQLPALTERAAEAVETLITEGPSRAMNRFHVDPRPSEG